MGNELTKEAAKPDKDNKKGKKNKRKGDSTNETGNEVIKDAAELPPPRGAPVQVFQTPGDEEYTKETASTSATSAENTDKSDGNDMMQDTRRHNIDSSKDKGKTDEPVVSFATSDEEIVTKKHDVKKPQPPPKRLNPAMRQLILEQKKRITHPYPQTTQSASGYTSVKPGVSTDDSDLIDVPWREVLTFHESERTILRKRLMEHPMYDDEEVPFYNVLLMGMVSHGKTSVINTMGSAIVGEVTSLAPAGATAGGAGESVTRTFRMHKFKKQRKDPETVRVRYFDTMGIEGLGGISEPDLVYILDGHIKNGYMFSENGAIDLESLYFDKNPPLANQIHAVAACVDAAVLEQIGGSALEKITSYKRIVNSRDIPFCVLMTKVDLIYKTILQKDQAHKMYYSRTVEQAVGKSAAIFGVPPNQVFPLKNYHTETEPVLAFDILALTTCLKLMHMADGYVRSHLD